MTINTMKTLFYTFITLFCLFPIAVIAQQYDEETNQKVRDEVRKALEGYNSQMQLISDANAFAEERQEYIQSLMSEYFANENVFIYNDIDPSKSTGNSFQVKIYLENLVLWYKDGFNFGLDMKTTQISDVLNDASRPYVKVNVTQNLRGSYSVKNTYTNASTRLTFYISFDIEERLSGGNKIYLLNDTKISKVEEVSFVPNIKLIQPSNSITSIGKKIESPITWETNTISPLIIDLYRNGELAVNLTREGVANNFSWLPSDDLKNGSGYKIKISTNDGSFSDETSSFSLEEREYIRMLYPTAENSLVKGDTYELIWESNINSNFKVELLRNGSVVEVVAQNVKGKKTNWTVPTGESLDAGQGYRLKVSDVSGNTVGFSDDDLTVSAERVENFIQVVQPAVGSVIKRGSTANIEWRHNMSGNFKIVLIKGSNERFPIEASTSSQSNISFKVKKEFGTGDNYTIEVTSLVNPNVKKRSSVFIIKKRSPLRWVALGALGGVAALITQLGGNTATDNALPEPPLPGDQ